ncbi:SMR family transporter [Bacillus atrophaeus]|uniref:SMR family transporter n=1 Tax=Bacillus atrophaeus TaxID=1452 RepID=UPI00398B1B42
MIHYLYWRLHHVQVRKHSTRPKILPTIGVFVSFFISFFCISLALKTIPLNVVYAIWAG